MVDKTLMILRMGWKVGLGECGRLARCLPTYFPLYWDTQLDNIPQPLVHLGVTRSRILANDP